MTLLEKYLELFHKEICTKEKEEAENIRRQATVLYDVLPLEQQLVLKDIRDFWVDKGSSSICNISDELENVLHYRNKKLHHRNSKIRKLEDQIKRLTHRRRLIRRINRKWWVKYYETPLVEPGTEDSFGFEGPGRYRWQRNARKRHMRMLDKKEEIRGRTVLASILDVAWDKNEVKNELE